MNKIDPPTYSKNYNTLSAFRKQLISLLSTLIVCGIFALGGSLFTIWIARLTLNPVSKLAKDAAEIIGYPPYYGMLSSWSSMLWMATAAICLFTVSITRKNATDPAMQRFLFFSGLLSLFIAVDDMYLLHDRILPTALHTSENVFYLAYLFLMVAYLAIFFRQIARSDHIIFWIAFFFLAFSRGFYRLIPFLLKFNTANDMLKYVGIVFWLAFFARTAAKQLRR